MKNHPIIRALRTFAPEACFTMLSLRDWHSMTFAGRQITIECIARSAESEERLFQTLPDHEFSLPNMLVADMSVVRSVDDPQQFGLVIEALIVDE